MPQDPLFHRFTYTLYLGKHRPYLEIEFVNPELLEGKGNRTLALLDSGADHTVIPFSLGQALQLKPPESQEYESASGVGGNISLISRRCRFYIVCRVHKKLYGFDERVMWAYPDLVTQDQLKELIDSYKLNQELRDEAIGGTRLRRYFEQKIQSDRDSLKKLMDKFETGALLGRPFFSNFNNLQIFQRSREVEDVCFVTFKLLKDKIVDIKPMD